jgi:predicted regulator of Ras-like GTPase activity (Roadblock/LC7/MglB family)
VRGTRAVESWTLEPLEQFIRESGARLTLIMTPAGQVMAQHGFTRAVDVMAAAALGAAIFASSGEIAKMIQAIEFSTLNHQGRNHGIFLGGFDSRRGRLVVLVVFGMDSSIGLVQLFFDDLARALVEACPAADTRKPVLAADFERELDNSLASLFGG